MQFGMFCGLEVPRPWTEGCEQRLFQEALDEVALADRLGLDCAWAVEHHFLEECSHLSAPEVFLAAASQRTKQIRLGHGVVLMLPAYNHPARVAERIATLDLVSNGRVEWGTGSSGSRAELEGFGIDPRERHAMWREGVEQATRMLAMEPYPGFEGKHFSMPCRNVVPKPVQRPHPPLWLACSSAETVRVAARLGMGALTFATVDVKQARGWVDDYYDVLKRECVPLGYTVNANIAVVTNLACHKDGDEAMRRFEGGLRFSQLALEHHYSIGRHKPGRTDIGSLYEGAGSLVEQAVLSTGGIGDPEKVRAHVQAFEEAGVDQLILHPQGGRAQHAHVCESLRLFASEVMPAVKARESERAAKKRAELAPYIEAALARRPPSPELRDDEVPEYFAYGLNAGNVDHARLSDEERERQKKRLRMREVLQRVRERSAASDWRDKDG